MASCLSLKLKPLMGFPSSGLESPKLSPPSVGISFRRRSYVISALKVAVAAGFAPDNNFRAITNSCGCTVYGCPRRVPLSDNDLQMDLDRWMPDESTITPFTMKIDTCKIKSGIYKGLTTGEAISVRVSYFDRWKNDFDKMFDDITSGFEYGINIKNGGIAFPSEAIGRVAAGAIAKKILETFWGVEVLAYVSQVDNVILPDGLIDHESLTTKLIDSNFIRCPDPEYSAKMISAIDALRVRGDPANGVVTCIIRNASRGVGSPVLDKVKSKLVKALVDYLQKSVLNLVGVSQGGISNGEMINLRIEFKPHATIRKCYQNSAIMRNTEERKLFARGRDDPCLAPKVVPLVEAVVALALAEELIS